VKQTILSEKERKYNRLFPFPDLFCKISFDINVGLKQSNKVVKECEFTCLGFGCFRYLAFSLYSISVTRFVW
jgi:hypothetical protein